MNTPPILFIHIAKTAGTSLRALLGTRIAGSAVLEIPEGTKRGSKILAHVDDYELVVGHVRYDITQAFQRPPVVLTFLREPIDRTLSAYYFLRQTQDSNIPNSFTTSQRRKRQGTTRQARELALRDFIHAQPVMASAHLGNVQTRILGSQGGSRRRRRTLGAADLARAKENLEACRSFGLTERVDASMTLICDALHWAPFAGFPHANPTHDRAAVADLDSSTLDALREFTQLDQELYRFATELFEQRWQALSASQPTTGAMTTDVRGESTFCFDRRIPGVGWYGSERMDGSWFSWTGPDTVSSIDLRPPHGDQVLLRVSVAHALHPDALHQTQLFVNDTPLDVRVHSEGNAHHLEAVVPATVLHGRDEVARIAIRTPFVLRPCDVDPTNGDTRELGLAVTSVSLLPAT